MVPVVPDLVVELTGLLELVVLVLTVPLDDVDFVVEEAVMGWASA